MTKKQEVSTQVTSMATLAEQGQEGIPGMLELINSKITELKKGQADDPSTKGKSLPGFGELKDITKVSELIKAHSSVINREKAYKQSAEAMGMNLSKFPFKMGGCSANQWVNDIIARASILANKVELEKLEKTKKILEENLSQDAKLKNDLARIATMYSDVSPLED